MYIHSNAAFLMSSPSSTVCLKGPISTSRISSFWKVRRGKPFFEQLKEVYAAISKKQCKRPHGQMSRTRFQKGYFLLTIRFGLTLTEALRVNMLITDSNSIKSKLVQILIVGCKEQSPKLWLFTLYIPQTKILYSLFLLISYLYLIPTFSELVETTSCSNLFHKKLHTDAQPKIRELTFTFVSA